MKTGTKAKAAKAARAAMASFEKIPEAEDSLLSVFPAPMYTTDGGATPKRVPKKNAENGTSMTGEEMLINQFGQNGVIRRKIM